MTTDSDLSACASSSDIEIRYERALQEYKQGRAERRKRQDAEEVQRLKNAKLARRLRRDKEEAERIRQAEAVQAQRDKWKAVSARYYVKHPEIKEKKRAKMAEKRAARKLARRRWDPPKAARERDGDGQLADFSATPDLDMSPEGAESGFPTHNEVLQEFLASSNGDHDTADTVAAASLLFLQTHRPHLKQSPGASAKPWSSLAPDYDSSLFFGGEYYS
ncbi:hypothetical protein B0H14DRAFT_2564552 [Mycena olivaceomarginata]|nr:hypothetical protein B0H14DRAFT_2564552 [Mycena olivaceomarginata]